MSRIEWPRRRQGNGNADGSGLSQQAPPEKSKRELDAHRNSSGEFETAVVSGSARLPVFSRVVGASVRTPSRPSVRPAERKAERMSIPSTWMAQPKVGTNWLARQVKAVLMGLSLGLVTVLPAVFWLTGHLGDRSAPPEAKPSMERGQAAERPEPEQLVASSDQPAIVLTAPGPPTRSSDPAKTAGLPTEEIEALLDRAKGFIVDGNMVRARQVLSDISLADSPMAAFVLAETYDPNILAATGAQGVRAEVERARTLYGQALAGGVAAAQKRLDALH